MLRPTLLAVAAVATLLSACGGPKAGTNCDKLGYLCADKDTALECRQTSATYGTKEWVELPCKGPDGCRATGSEVSCDVSGSVEGDACATSMEGKGLCAADGKKAYVCRSGTFVVASVCQTCSVQSGEVICQP